MDIITQIELANYEKVQPPEVEKSNFAYSFSLLPKDERNAMKSIYAFCDYIDSIVDSTPTESKKSIELKIRRLQWWEKVIENIYNDKHNNSLLFPLVSAIKRYSIPKQYFFTLIDGCKKDLFKYRYKTFDELKAYCYGVASIVGLISIEIFGYKYEDTKNYAINLGYALQLTNILRDIKADKDRNYIYLPQEDLEKFEYSEQDLMNEVYNENFIELMDYETNRAREYFHKARSFLHPDERVTLFTAEIIDAIYYRLLEKIELNNYNIWNKKIKVSNTHKLLIVLKHWLSIQMFISRFRTNSSN